MRVAIFSLVLIVLLSSGQSVFAREIVISTFEKPSPIISTAESIMQEAYRRLGHQLKIVKLPGERALFTANKGDIDGELVRVDGVDKNYENLVKVPGNLFTIEFVVFTKEKIFPVTGWKSLSPYTVGYRMGVKAIELNLTEDIDTIAVQTYKQIFKMLNSGRCDVVVASRTSGMEAIQVMKLKSISALEPPLEQMKLYHYLHMKNKDLVAPLTSVLQQMEAEGLLNTYKASSGLSFNAITPILAFPLSFSGSLSTAYCSTKN